MRGQRGWRELAVLGDKINKVSGLIEGLIWSPRGSSGTPPEDDNWAAEEVIVIASLKPQINSLVIQV